MISSPSVSVVIPSYGCVGTLVDLVQQIDSALGDDLAEIVIVDDRSPDGSWPMTRELAVSHSSVRALRLSRNFGQHAAIAALVRGGGVGAWAFHRDPYVDMICCQRYCDNRSCQKSSATRHMPAAPPAGRPSPSPLVMKPQDHAQQGANPASTPQRHRVIVVGTGFSGLWVFC